MGPSGISEIAQEECQGQSPRAHPPSLTGREQGKEWREAREGTFCGSTGKCRKGAGGSGECPESSSRIGSDRVHSVCNWQVIGTLLRAISVGWAAAACNDLEYKFEVEMQ